MTLDGILKGEYYAIWEEDNQGYGDEVWLYYKSAKHKFIQTLEMDMDYYRTRFRFREEELWAMSDNELMTLYYYVWGVGDTIYRFEEKGAS